jgi:hypothetical protein
MDRVVNHQIRFVIYTLFKNYGRKSYRKEELRKEGVNNTYKE